MVIVAAITALAVLAIRRLAKRGLCDCGDHCEGPCDGCPSQGCCRGCKGCDVAEEMAQDMGKL